ncbi:unnamed protein product, partial [Penicillium pancosmium]
MEYGVDEDDEELQAMVTGIGDREADLEWEDVDDDEDDEQDEPHGNGPPSQTYANE